MNALESARQAGIDLSLIEENLRLTPEQRVQQHQLALDMAQQLCSAYKAPSKPQYNDQPEHPVRKID